MEIFGIGGMELAAIVIIMLVVAGPKRMIQWAYVLGQYTAKLRGMWREVMTAVQKEMNQSGVEVNLPKEIPTRNSLKRQMEQALSGVTRPAQDILDDVKSVQTAAAEKVE